MMLIEEQRREPIRVSYSPKPLDTTTQESSRSENLEPLINEMYSASQVGKKLNNSYLFNSLSEVFRSIAKTPSQLDLLQNEYAKILQEENKGIAWENTYKFVAELKNLGADDRVRSIILEQCRCRFLLSEYYNVTKTGKLLEEYGIKAVLNTILNVSDEEVNMYYSRYQQILQEEDMGVAKKNAVEFIGELRGLGADEKVCTIFSKQFGLHFLFNECYNAANTGKCLKDDDVKFLFNMLPGISDKLYRRYQLILQEKNMEVAREKAVSFIAEMESFRADEKVLAIIFNQFEFRFDFLEKYYNSRQVADAESIRRLLNKIPGVSSEGIDKLCEEYENIIDKKDANGTVGFIDKLWGIGADERICEIIQGEFYKFDILPAEVRQLISGRLFVPENAKFNKRYEYGGKFIRIGLFDEVDGYENLANRPLDEELVQYFIEEVIHPFEECKGYVPVYIEQMLGKKHPPKPREELERMLDVLTSGRIDVAFKKSLEIVTRFSKELVSVGNRENDRKLKGTVPPPPILLAIIFVVVYLMN